MASSLDKLTSNLERKSFTNTSMFKKGNQLERVFTPMSQKTMKQNYHQKKHSTLDLLEKGLAMMITNMRRMCGKNLANNEFEKDFFKLMNNSVFGKTMENIRKRVDIRLVNNEVTAKKLAAKPNFIHCNIFDENHLYTHESAIHMKKVQLVFNKPVYLGMCILDLSKTLMNDFHYNFMKKKYGEKAKLLFTDTESLAYEIQTDDFYKDISGDVVEFVGLLRSKLYSYKMLLGKEEKKCKEISCQEDYKKCWFTGREHLRKMNVIRSRRYDIYIENYKIALSNLGRWNPYISSWSLADDAATWPLNKKLTDTKMNIAVLAIE
ncbi:hypothetical protein CAPTEDRAFT_212481 [Capitella teleta]|uniref:Bromo domain-containing protein n=1 Tax=Capitella teleta TaxID=283909 RepID=R7TE01_CAPTE|nr:hypothetical protein CAPTEDRAFT_212481 [Capitella teleta]|eukprot:ELT91737.1 hypothetical protein CAPTEDRAFT_212481 [Capitella teleta]